MRENLLDGELTYRQYQLIEEMDTFDLEDFFYGKGPSTGAVCLITQNQMILCDTYIREKDNPRNGQHFKTVNAIYECIYGKRIKKGEWVNGEFISWQDNVVQDGNILIQLGIGRFVTSPVWLPESIEDVQLELLENFNKRIKLIVSSNPEYFNDNPIIFPYSTGNKSDELYNSLDELIEIVKGSKRR